jgi:hypothetical protein
MGSHKTSDLGFPYPKKTTSLSPSTSTLKVYYRAGRRSEDLLAVIGVGGLADATALDRSCAGDRINPPMPYMCASIVKGMKFSLISGLPTPLLGCL